MSYKINSKFIIREAAIDILSKPDCTLLDEEKKELEDVAKKLDFNIEEFNFILNHQDNHIMIIL